MSSKAKEIELDEAFIERVKNDDLPHIDASLPLSLFGLEPHEVVALFQSQVASRQIDYQARHLRAAGKGFYTISSAGHEGNAAIARAFRLNDMAFLHYRSGAFFIERARKKPGVTPIYDTLLGIAAAIDDPISRGRHKVFGSKLLSIPPQTSTIASHLPKAVGAALGVSKAAHAGIDSCSHSDSVVLCSFGDASFNHSTAQGAINTASLMAFQHIPLPLVFVCEDNGLGISVPTPQNFIQETMRSKKSIHYLPCDGRDLRDVYKTAVRAEQIARLKKEPVFLHMKTVRLMGHAGSDVESHYRSASDIAATEAEDPLFYSAALILAYRLLTPDAVISLYQGIAAQVKSVARSVTMCERHSSKETIMLDLLPQSLPKEWPCTLQETSNFTNLKNTKLQSKANIKSREQFFSAADLKLLKQPQHMAKLINWALTDILFQHQEALIFGEDVAQKGGVYNVTANLWKSFGGSRVFNSPLDEQSILGTAIGLSHMGFVPIPEIQFLAYLHNAEDQLRGEAATLSFFSASQYTNPMVIRIAGLAYQKGFGGHFHNDNALGVLRDIPGLLIACPSNGRDAVLMLRTLFHEAKVNRRVGVFLEPIALYMTKHLFENDGKWQHLYPEAGQTAKLGEANIIGQGEDLLIISYGNGVYLCEQAMVDLANEQNIHATLIDLRWLAPLDKTTIIEFSRQFKHVLLVDECRRTASISEEIVSMMVETLDPLPRILRHTAEDCFIPLGPASELLLPSRASIFKAAIQLLSGHQLSEVA